MGWVRNALKELGSGRAVTVCPTGGQLRGRIEPGQTVTISPADPASIMVDDVVLVRWRDNPMLLLVKAAQGDQLVIGDTLGETRGWVPRSAVLGKMTEMHRLPEGNIPKPRIRTFRFGLDSPNDYGPDRVLDALGGLSLKKADRPSCEAVQVLFLPSFHPECCLTATLDEQGPQLTLVTMQTSLWYWWCYQMMQASGNWDEREQPPPRPQRWQETAPIPADRLAGFRSELGATNPASLSDTRSVGIDGMDVQGQYRRVEGTTTVFRHHISHDFSQHHSFVLAVYRLGIDLLRAEQSVRAVEGLHGYLDVGLPLKLLPERPLTVRIFGSLSSSQEQELRAALARVPEEEPVLMDMSNLDGMGTLLYPVFQHFLGRRGRTLWWASPAAEEHLKAMQVPSFCIFDNRETAVASLANR